MAVESFNGKDLQKCVNGNRNNLGLQKNGSGKADTFKIINQILLKLSLCNEQIKESYWGEGGREGGI